MRVTGSPLAASAPIHAGPPREPIPSAMKHALPALAALWILLTPALGITSGREVAATDRRFDAVAGFTRTEWRDINNVFGNATLVTPDRVVLPRHLINDQFKVSTSTDGAAADFAVRFRRRPDGGVGDVNNPASFHHVRVKEWIFPNGRKDVDDVVIGVLETPVTHITPIAMDFKPKSPTKSTILLASWGPEGPPADNAPKGRLLIGNVKLRGAGGWLTLAARSKNAPTEVVLHDSGAPVFAISNNAMRMIGFVSTTAGGPSLKEMAGTRLFPRIARGR